MKYNSKWAKVRISKNKRRQVYDRLRLIANTILKKRHKREYSKILHILLNKEYKKLKDEKAKIREHYNL